MLDPYRDLHRLTPAERRSLVELVRAATAHDGMQVNMTWEGLVGPPPFHLGANRVPGGHHWIAYVLRLEGGPNGPTWAQRSVVVTPDDLATPQPPAGPLRVELHDAPHGVTP